MDPWTFLGNSLFEIDDRWKRLVIHLNGLWGVFRDVTVSGNDEGHRLAPVFHLIAGQGDLCAGMFEAWVGNQEGKGV